MTIQVSVGIPASNEEDNIGKLLTALLNQNTNRIEITEIIVVSSGSRDDTDAIVTGFSQRQPKIRLIKQSIREGKASAINEFLKVAHNQVVVLESADTIPLDYTIERLCLPFEDLNVGMTGAHPIPINGANNFMGYVTHLQWDLHDRIAIRRSKCGELVAFRKLFEGMPQDTAVDEAWIEYEITKRKYSVVYVDDAFVFNKGPESVTDFLKQRRRINCGHIDLTKRTAFKVSTTSFFTLLPALVEVFPSKSLKKSFFLLSAFALEAICKMLGYYDYYKNKDQHLIWEVSKTTKNLGSYAS